MANTLLFNPFIQIVNANGKPYAGAKLYTYQTGTTTPLATYTNAALTVAHPNPVIADANGTFPPIYLQKQSYKLRVETSGGVLIDESDPVDSTESAVEQYVNSLLQTTLNEIIQDLYAGQSYRTVNNGATTSQLFSVNSASTSSNIGLNASGNDLDINFSYVNTNSQNIRNAYIKSTSTSKTAGSENASFELGLRTGQYLNLSNSQAVFANGASSSVTLRATTAVDTADREIGSLNFQEPEGTGDGTLAIEASIKGFRGDTDSFNSSGALAFFTKPFAGTLTERLRITPAGGVGIGLTAPNSKLTVAVSPGLSNDDGISAIDASSRSIAINRTGNAYSYQGITGAVGLLYSSNSLALMSDNTNPIQFSAGGFERMRITSGGAVHFPSVGTTASAANAFLDSGSSPANQLLRSTSSIKYKTNVENLTIETAEKALNLRPVTYKSLAEADDQTKTHFGLIAEEVAEIEPRLVHYVDGQPDGVQYERLSVMLLKVVQDLKQELDELKAQIQGV